MNLLCRASSSAWTAEFAAADMPWCARARYIGNGDEDLTRRAHALLHVNKESAVDGADRAISFTRRAIIAFARAIDNGQPWVHVVISPDASTHVDVSCADAFTSSLRGHWCERSANGDWTWAGVDVAYAWNWALFLHEVVLDRCSLMHQTVLTIRIADMPPNLVRAINRFGDDAMMAQHVEKWLQKQVMRHMMVQPAADDDFTRYNVFADEPGDAENWVLIEERVLINCKL